MSLDLHKKPLARDDVTVQDIAEEVMLYDSSNEKVHVLNHTAFAIWKMCNGTNTVEDICAKLAAQFPDAGKDIDSDIQLILTDFKKKRLLV